MPGLDHLHNFTLVICEKPEAAKRMAETISEKRLIPEELEGVDIFIVQNGGKNYVVCSALGHLYTVEDPTQRRNVYPVFDVEWFPTSALNSKLNHIARRLEVISRLAQKAERFVHACDFDLEGETIGYNILRYACGGKENVAYRARFSTLTPEELKRSLADARPAMGAGLAEAGRTRHVVDFVWGVNLSRALSEAFFSVNKRYRMITIGRVQGPTLSYIVDREIAIRTFVPAPYWKIAALFESQGKKFEAMYERDRVDTLAEAQAIKAACERKTGSVQQIRKTLVKQNPPAPFNLGDLQREAYRVFGFSPAQTLSVAERLYLDALISYPRTNSQKFPSTIDYRKILTGIQRMEHYRHFAREILNGDLHPWQGEKEDPAHPAIYPTGELPSRVLEPRELRLFDLIVRRFFAVFAKEALRESLTAQILVGECSFKLFGRRTLEEGWLRYYGIFSDRKELPLPALTEGDEVQVSAVNVSEKFEQPPPRFNQSSLLEKMEREGIGTKTTRAEIISTLYERGYTIGESISATDIAFAVAEAMKAHSPDILSPEMTKIVERDLERIENGDVTGKFVLEKAIEPLRESLPKIKAGETMIGHELRRAVLNTVHSQSILGQCPVCELGKLTIVRSRSTRKRFVGCTNYSQGCTATAPLPQRGILRTTTRVCQACGWPIVYVRMRRFPWKLCVNPKCPKKVMKKYEVRAVS